MRALRRGRARPVDCARCAVFAGNHAARAGYASGGSKLSGWAVCRSANDGGGQARHSDSLRKDVIIGKIESYTLDFEIEFSDRAGDKALRKGVLMDEQKMLKLQTWVKEAKRIVFFGGAGVSTESGIPDFRG